MTEPVDRYTEFGSFLASNGYNVFVMEIRGHGELKEGEIGEHPDYEKALEVIKELV